MPYKAKKACAKSGCTNLTDKGNYCKEHTVIRKPFASKDYKTYHTQRMSTPAWESYRLWFLRHNPLCVQCGAPSRVLDHIIDHKGDRDKFWDKSNHQALCVLCHNRKTMLEAKKR